MCKHIKWKKKRNPRSPATPIGLDVRLVAHLQGLWRQVRLMGRVAYLQQQQQQLSLITSTRGDFYDARGLVMASTVSNKTNAASERCGRAYLPNSGPRAPLNRRSNWMINCAIASRTDRTAATMLLLWARSLISYLPRVPRDRCSHWLSDADSFKENMFYIMLHADRDP